MSTFQLKKEALSGVVRKVRPFILSSAPYLSQKTGDVLIWRQFNLAFSGQIQQTIIWLCCPSFSNKNRAFTFTVHSNVAQNVYLKKKNVVCWFFTQYAKCKISQVQFSGEIKKKRTISHKFSCLLFSLHFKRTLILTGLKLRKVIVYIIFRE